MRIIGTDGRTVLDASNAVGSPKWDKVFTVTGATLRTLDGTTGATISEQDLPATGLRPMAGSIDGEWVALSDAPTRVGDGVMEPGQERTTVVVAPSRPDPSRPQQTMVLVGNFTPEAFSVDDRRLFVIEYLPPLNPDRYRVRQLDIGGAKPGPVLTFEKVDDTEEMRGLSRTQVLSPTVTGGPFLYTLYTKIQGDDAQYGFVHVLQLGGGLVHCIDLPATLGLDQKGGSIALSPDGTRLYVASATGTVAELDTTQNLSSHAPFPILRTTTVATPATPASSTAISVDGSKLWVALGSAIVSVDRRDLQPGLRLTVDGPVAALAPGPSGSLVAATTTGLVLVDTASAAQRLLAAITPPVRHLAVSPAS